MHTYAGPLQTVVLSNTLWLVVLLPLLGAIVNAAVGWRMQRSAWGQHLAARWHIGAMSVSAVAIGAMTLSFALAVAHVVQLAALPETQRYLLCHLWPMVRVGSFDLSFDLALDPVSAVMLLVVTGVGLLIHVYAAGYMQKEPSYWRFFSYLNLFIFAMLLLVLGDNFVVMFFGWEGVGLCSYLLIGFWYKDYKKASAGTKAFLTNRIGDFGFLTGLFVLLWSLGGGWTEDGYRPDVTPRLVPVVVEHDSVEHERVVVPKHITSPLGPSLPSIHAPAVSTFNEDPFIADPSTEAFVRASAEAAALGAKMPLSVPLSPPRASRELGIHDPSKAYVTFTSFAGAKVFINGDTTAPLTVPFVRHPVSSSSSRHTLLVKMGGATEDLLLENVELVPGKETILTPVGTVLSFRDVANQLRTQDRVTATHPLKERLAGKRLWGIAVITIACLGFFVGAAGKSAQIPLYVWLPDAMAGPTPVSALIHAATMVTAGVYMVARLNFLFSMSPVACGVVALVGALTALFAATIGFFQYDIKRVLAYSTVSQLGFMFIGVGVGAYWTGLFHVVTHAFFKACLFLTAGSVIHAMHAIEPDADRAQDMRVMGGLKTQMPRTRLAYLISCLAITAAPIPLFAGFWSKDEILWNAFASQNTGFVPGMLIWAIGFAAAVGTSFYMWRSYYLTFEGPFCWTPAEDNVPGEPFKIPSVKLGEKLKTKIKESPPVMTGVLLVLAFFSTVSGAVLGFSTHYFGFHPGESGYIPPLLEHWVEPVLRYAKVSFASFGAATLVVEHVLIWSSVLFAVGAWAVAKKRYGATRPVNWQQKERAIVGWKLLHNKYYVDEIYDRFVIRPVLALRLFLRDFDRYVIDALVNFVAVMTKLVSKIEGLIDTYVVDGIVNLVGQSSLRFGAKLRKLQTGQIQHYAYGVLGGVATLAFIMFLIRYYGIR